MLASLIALGATAFRSLTQTIPVRLIALSAFAFATLAPASALAQPAHQNYVGAGQVVFGGSAEPGEVVHPEHVVVDPDEGRVLVSDSGHSRISTYLPEGETLAYQGSFGVGVLAAPYGLAIDPALHFVYVSDSATNQIVRFKYSPGPIPGFSVDSSYVSPELGNGPGQLGSFKVALAIDPNTNDLLVADTANSRVSRFSPAGTFLSSFDGNEGAGGPFAGPLDIAAGPSGELVVVDSSTPLSIRRVERFTSNGNWIGNVSVPGLPESVGINEATGMVSVGIGPREAHPDIASVVSFIEGEFAGQVPLQTGLRATGLAVDPRPDGQLYVVKNDHDNTIELTDGVQAYTPVLAPGVSVGAATGVTPNSADLNGKVDPGGRLTSSHFEYSANGIQWTPLPELEPLEGNGEVAVHQHLEGLQPNFEYQIRLVAANESTGSVSSPKLLSTLALPPGVTTLPASGITSSEATLNGLVIPFGKPTTFYFEYGETAAYGLRVPADSDGLAGAGRIPVGVSRTIEGLRDGAPYHYRLVAESSAGTTFGIDRTFSASSNAGSARAFEEVSPVDTEGRALNALVEFQASESGDAAVVTAVNAGPSGPSAPAAVRLLSTRGSNWNTVPIDPPGTTNYGEYAANLRTGNLSADLAHSLVISNYVLAPGGISEAENVYVRSNLSATYQFVTTISNAEANLFLHNQGGILYGASADWGSVVLQADEVLAPGGEEQKTMLYQFVNGALRLVSRLPDGTPTAVTTQYHVNAVSTDGTRLAFAAAGGGTYLREDEASIALSVSHRPGDPSTVQPARYIDSSSNGRFVFFQVTSEAPLTTSAPEAPGDIYRYDADAGSLVYIDGTGGVSARPLPELAARTRLGVSEDGGTLLYTVGPVGSQEELFSWRDGTSRDLIRNFESSALRARTEEGYMSALSDNGRWLALSTTQPLTGQTSENAVACSIKESNFQLTGACPQIFRVDTESGAVVCVSCRPDGSRPEGVSSLGPQVLGLHQDRSVDDRGDVFFDTPNSLVNSDSNGAEDVYEYAGETASLISGGKPGHESFFADASTDGSNVFFFTDEQLVSQDRNKI